MLFDSHLHLQDLRLKSFVKNELAQVLTEQSYTMAVNGTHPDDWNAVQDLANKLPHSILPNYGLHPWKVAHRPENWVTILEGKLHQSPYQAIGECGLDRWIKPTQSELEDQVACFSTQLKIATELNAPISIHCLKATQLLIQSLNASPLPDRGVMLHSFSGSPETFRELLKLNVYFSISPYFFHAKKQDQLASFKQVPIDRILLETDAPDMAGPPSLFSCEKYPDINTPTQLAKLYELASAYFDINPEQFTQNALNYFTPPKQLNG